MDKCAFDEVAASPQSKEKPYVGFNVDRIMFNRLNEIELETASIKITGNGIGTGTHVFIKPNNETEWQELTNVLSVSYRCDANGIGVVEMILADVPNISEVTK